MAETAIECVKKNAKTQPRGRTAEKWGRFGSLFSAILQTIMNPAGLRYQKSAKL
jgi:hypothetical protein